MGCSQFKQKNLYLPNISVAKIFDISMMGNNKDVDSEIFDDRKILERAESFCIE